MKNESTTYSNFALRLVLVCTILILGSTIIFAFNQNFKKGKEEKTESKEDTSEKDLINKLYQYVSYGRDLQPMTYFFQNKELTNETFDALEKVRYAFQLANKKEVFDLTDKGFKVLGDTYKGWIEEIFGKGTPFDNSKTITLYTNDLLKNSIVNIEYNQKANQYIVTKENGFIKEDKDEIQDYYTKMDTYHIDPINHTIQIDEKVIFVGKEWNVSNKISNIKVYKDIYKTKLIQEIKEPTKEVLKDFRIEDYWSDAATISYTFQLGEDNNYYFSSSKIEE